MVKNTLAVNVIGESEDVFKKGTVSRKLIEAGIILEVAKMAFGYLEREKARRSRRFIEVHWLFKGE